MLDKALVEHVVMDVKDILKDALENKVSSPAELPYFDGDFWPNALEESIKEIEQDEEKRRRELEEAAAAQSDGSGGSDDELDPSGANGTPRGKLGKGKEGKNRKRKAMNSKRDRAGRHKGKRSSAPATAQDLSKKMYEIMERHKDVFFVVRLQLPQVASQLPPIVDPDPLLHNDLLDGRDAFLCLCRDKHFEFSSLRRCCYSSLMILYEIHNTQSRD